MTWELQSWTKIHDLMNVYMFQDRTQPQSAWWSSVVTIWFRTEWKQSEVTYYSDHRTAEASDEFLAICTNQRPSDLLPASQRPVLQGHVTCIGQSEASIAGEDRNTIEEVTGEWGKEISCEGKLLARGGRIRCWVKGVWAAEGGESLSFNNAFPQKLNKLPNTQRFINPNKQNEKW